MGSTPIRYDPAEMPYMLGKWPRTKEAWNSRVERAMSEVLENFTDEQIDSIKRDLQCQFPIAINKHQTFEQFLFLRVHGCGVWCYDTGSAFSVQSRSGVCVFGDGIRVRETDFDAFKWVFKNRKHPICRWALGFDMSRRFNGK